jgi:hypothetical protein
MPPAKKAAARGASRGSSKAGYMTAATRLQLERAAKRLEKSLDEANDALKALGRDVGHGGHRSYKDLSTALTALRRDAKKTNRALIDDLRKLRAAVTPSRASSKRAVPKRSSTSRGPSKSPSRSSKRRRAG